MDTTLIDNAIEQAYNERSSDPYLFDWETTKSYFFQPETPVNGNPNQTVEVHLYKNFDGQKGFRVVGRIKNGSLVATRVKNFGPDTASEKPWGNLEEELQLS